MPLTPVEVIAAILAIVSLIKLTVILTDKRKWWPIVNSVYGNSTVSGLVMVVLAAVVLYYLLLEMTIVQIFAASAFMALLMGLGFVAYGKDTLAFAKKIYMKKFSGLMWLYILVWLALMLWVLYEIFL